MSTAGAIPAASDKPRRRNTSNKRISRILKKREPQLVEFVKSALILKGQKTSAVIVSVLRDIYRMKKPEAVMFSKHNEVRPFEDETSLEFFSVKNNASLFAYGSHSKKRPHNLILGRFFNNHILDMIELGVENYQGIEEFEGPKAAIGAKPCFMFSGADWEIKDELKQLANLLVDFFRGAVVSNICLDGLDHVIVCTAVVQANGTPIVHFRQYGTKLKKTGTKLPYVELHEMGPHMDLVLRRTKFAAPDLAKEALKQPKQLKPSKTKNITTNAFGDRVGRVHMERQDLSQMALRRFKAHKRPVEGDAADGETANAEAPASAPAPAPAATSSDAPQSKKQKKSREEN